MRVYFWLWFRLSMVSLGAFLVIYLVTKYQLTMDIKVSPILLQLSNITIVFNWYSLYVLKLVLIVLLWWRMKCAHVSGQQTIYC